MGRAGGGSVSNSKPKKRKFPGTPTVIIEGVKSEFRIEPFHLGTRRVAEVVPHLGLPIRGPSRRHAL